jgi:hypothetical protein
MSPTVREVSGQNAEFRIDAMGNHAGDAGR